MKHPFEHFIAHRHVIQLLKRKTKRKARKKKRYKQTQIIIKWKWISQTQINIALMYKTMITGSFLFDLFEPCKVFTSATCSNQSKKNS